jgi:hypothetical protein
MRPKNPNQIIDYSEPEWILPYQYMSVGESFFIPTMRPAYAHYIVDVTSKRVQVPVKAYTCVEEGILGVRVWRIG